MAIKLNYLSISDSIATPSSTFIAIDSTNGGNNTGWNFANTINGAANITSTATLLANFPQAIWTEVPMSENTWNIIG